MAKEQQYEQQDNSGVLFLNENKEGESYPDFFGSAVIHGESLNIAAWKNKSKKSGKAFLALRFSDPNAFAKKKDDKRPAKKNDDDFPF